MIWWHEYRVVTPKNGQFCEAQWITSANNRYKCVTISNYLVRQYNYKLYFISITYTVMETSIKLEYYSGVWTKVQIWFVQFIKFKSHAEQRYMGILLHI